MKKLHLLKTLLVAVCLLVGGVNCVWGTTEIYDFQSFVWGLNGAPGISNYSDYAKTINKQTLSYLPDFVQENFSANWRTNSASYAFLNNRFASQGNFTCIRSSSEKCGIRHTQGGNRYFSIMNLNEGDVVSIKYAGGTVTFQSSNVKLKSTDEAVASGATVVSESEYVMTADGDLDLVVPKNDPYFQKVVIVLNPENEEVGCPNIELVSAYYDSRTAIVNGGTTNKEGATIASYRYTIDGTTPSATSGTLYNPESKIVFNEKKTIKAVAVSSTGKASLFYRKVLEAGTTLSLNIPVVNMKMDDDFTRNGDLFYPKYGFTSDQSSVLGTPDVTYSYTIAGASNINSNPTEFSEGKAGLLLVTANADGYASATSEGVVVTPYVLSKSYDFSSEYELNSNWSLNNNNASMPQGDYTIKGKRYVPIAEAKSKTNTFGTLFDGLAFSNRETTGDYYYYVQGLGIGQVGGSGINNTTVSVADLSADNYTVYKKYNSGNTVSNFVVKGNSSWNLGKMSGTGAGVLHGVFVYSPATSAQSGIVGALDYSTGFAGAQSEDIILANGDSKKVTFKNHGLREQVYYNWCLGIQYFNSSTNAYEFKANIRADWAALDAGGAFTYPWTYSIDGGATAENVDVWADFSNDMQDSEVELTLTHKDGKLYVIGTMSKGNNIYYYSYCYGDGSLTENIKTYLFVEKAWLEVISVEDVAAVTTPAHPAAIKTTIGSTGYSTFTSTLYPLDLSDITGAEAFYANGVASDKVKFTSTEDEVSTGVGLLLKGTASQPATIKIADEGAEISGNLLVGCTTATTLDVNANYYVMVNNEGTAEFQSLDVQGATIPAGKAYLNAAGASARLSFDFDDDNTTTGIRSIDNGQLTGGNSVYNLNGQRVDNPKKGLYIVNGKKYINK